MFDDYNLVIQAAVEGLGVPLARGALVAAELRAAMLMRPFEMAINSDRDYYLVWSGAAAGDGAFEAFRAWILTEVDAAA